MRAIIPIFIESLDLLIETKKDLLAFLENGSEMAKSMAVISGDVSSLLYGYADDDNVKKYDQIKEDYFLKKIELPDPRIVLPGNVIAKHEGVFLLAAGKYYTPANNFLFTSEVTGYHRQKTVIGFEEATLISGKKTKFKFLTLGKNHRGTNSEVIIATGSVLSLESCVVDSLTIVVEDGAVLELKDVDFKGGIEAIVQRGNGKVINNGGVRFDGVAFEYHFENLTSDSAVGLVNVKDQKSIREFLSKSKADKIFVECDLNFAESGPITFENETSFLLNELKCETDAIKMQFKDATISKNISFASNCYVEGHFKAIDAVNAKFELGTFLGIVDLENSDVNFGNTVFLPTDQLGSIRSEYSKIAFEECVFTGDKKRKHTPIKTSFSEIHFEKVKFKHMDHIVDVNKHIKAVENGTEESIMEFEHEKSAITFNELVIEDCDGIINTDGQLTSFTGKKIKLKNTKHGIVLANCQVIIDTIIIDGLQSEGVSITGNSLVQISGENSVIINTKMPMSFSNGTYAELVDIMFDSNLDGPALSLEDCIVVCHNTKFRKNTTAVHIKRAGLLVNDGIKFNENTQNVKKDHESLNIMEYPEWLIEREKMFGAQQ